MARQLLFTPATPLTASQAGLAAVTLLLCAFALIKCASHTRKLRRHWKACCEFFEDEPAIEITHEVMTTNRAFDYQPEDAITGTFSCEQPAPVWQRNILMGEKCQLPDFSGVIIYDSEGNIVTPSKTPRPLLLTWK